MTIYVKKVWSYNPTLYKFIALKEAQDGYFEYCKAVVDTVRRWNGSAVRLKTFQEWLTTEI